ncbi:Pre-mRNA splicing Prp18-interacting factor-domain-containing protein [Halteromyces radiatus]|uniref:Pre-mRNA splicing Prp18-interacting factor-domain-containing protein n=1 Tax=Halteromyces radiatus TaxID=101107 RepID=UPI00221E739B|nr:Pre-mRNA splicing Prp18-interacting factor-domain-containing protein [Halteromyces radiatus]KAI8084695.1 Pre-mRNA splicing Prp18-interacting factor-domain-containing protein [Halteromyces radiatus]
MSSTTQTNRLTKEEYRRQKDLDAARKAGTAPAAIDDEGNEINPHTPQFMLNAPWYVDTGKVSLKHQRAPEKRKGPKFGPDDNYWYARGKRVGPAATKYRKGACENCGAISHKTRDCVERPRKKGAKWTGKNIQADEIIQEADLDWDEKRDRWNGYDPKEHDQVIEEYNKVEEARRSAKASELDKEGPTTTQEAKKWAKQNKTGQLSDDEDNGNEDDDDDDKYADQADMPGQHVNQKTRTTIRNLRIREDTAKYLLNLDTESAFYDPKTRSMRDNPLKDKPEDQVSFAGDNFTRYTGDAPEMAKVQMFAWQAGDRGSQVHLQANPTQIALLHKDYEAKKDKVRGSTQKGILEKYGGAEHLESLPKELLLAQSENYVEYSRTGRVIKGQEKAKARSKYEEDVFINNHHSVWGSYWSDGKWGYQCCRSFMKNSYCTGQAGIEAQQSSAQLLQ